MEAEVIKIIVKVTLGAALTAAGGTLGKHAAKELEVLLKTVR